MRGGEAEQGTVEKKRGTGEVKWRKGNIREEEYNRKGKRDK